MAQQPYMVLHRYYYHIYQMFSQVDFNAHVGGTAIAPAADLLVQGTSAVPLLAFDQAHWRRSKLSTAGRGISESGPSEQLSVPGIAPAHNKKGALPRRCFIYKAGFHILRRLTLPALLS